MRGREKEAHSLKARDCVIEKASFELDQFSFSAFMRRPGSKTEFSNETLGSLSLRSYTAANEISKKAPDKCEKGRAGFRRLKMRR